MVLSGHPMELVTGTRIGTLTVPALTAVRGTNTVRYRPEPSASVLGMNQPPGGPQNGSPPEEEDATPAETRAALLKRSKRSAAPIRKTFVQRPQGEAVRHGVLRTFVNNGDHRGLKAHLFLMAINSNGDDPDGWSTTLPLSVWARAFDTTIEVPSSATTAVTKTLTRLVDRKLIKRDRAGRERKVKVTILREDGSGQPYTHPATETGRENLYLRLPYAFWTDGWHSDLSLAATAMLLVALAEKPVFQLATERVPEWYGWSADTAERGFAELVDKGLLEKTQRRKKAPLSPTGSTTYNEYQLIGAFRQKPKKTAPAKTAPKKTKKAAKAAAPKAGSKKAPRRTRRTVTKTP